MEYVLLTVLALIVFGVLTYRAAWFRDKLRAIEWNDRKSYIRFWPNFGFRIMGFRWSKHYGRRIK